jgi:hypothetical protein
MTSVKDALDAVSQRHGRLAPEDVVEDARPVGSTLHAHFEWDDSVGGEKYRLVQARALIRSVKVTTFSADETVRQVRAFVATPTLRRYMPQDEVARDPVLREVTLSQMRREWLLLRRKYQEMAEFWELVAQDAPGDLVPV